MSKDMWDLMRANVGFAAHYMGLSSSLSQDNAKVEWDFYGISMGFISWDFVSLEVILRY